MMKRSKNIILGTLIFLTVFAITLFGILKFQKYLAEKTLAAEQKFTILEAKSGQTNLQHLINNKPPKTAYLEVPFVCQAPLQTLENWKLHEESCEEAAVLQSFLYENNRQISREEANIEVLRMIDWQIKNFGGHNDLYADKLKEFIKGYYHLPENQIEIIRKATIDNIKKEIATGHPVIVPITGDILKNPYYPYPGYHMLVAIGYTESKIITNDNGTRRGKDFSYDTKIFEAAMKDAGGDIVILKIKP